MLLSITKKKKNLTSKEENKKVNNRMGFVFVLTPNKAAIKLD